MFRITAELYEWIPSSEGILNGKQGNRIFVSNDLLFSKSKAYTRAIDSVDNVVVKVYHGDIADCTLYSKNICYAWEVKWSWKECGGIRLFLTDAQEKEQRVDVAPQTRPVPIISLPKLTGVFFSPYGAIVCIALMIVLLLQCASEASTYPHREEVQDPPSQSIYRDESGDKTTEPITYEF